MLIKAKFKREKMTRLLVRQSNMPKKKQKQSCLENILIFLKHYKDNNLLRINNVKVRRFKTKTKAEKLEKDRERKKL